MTSRESLLVNPGIPVPEESRAVHGITDEELAGAPDFATVMPRVLELLQGTLPVAYNASFDRGFHHRGDRAGSAEGMTPGDMPPAARDDVVWVDPLVWAREISQRAEEPPARRCREAPRNPARASPPRRGRRRSHRASICSHWRRRCRVSTASSFVSRSATRRFRKPSLPRGNAFGEPRGHQSDD